MRLTLFFCPLSSLSILQEQMNVHAWIRFLKFIYLFIAMSYLVFVCCSTMSNPCIFVSNGLLLQDLPSAIQPKGRQVNKSHSLTHQPVFTTSLYNTCISPLNTEVCLDFYLTVFSDSLISIIWKNLQDTVAVLYTLASDWFPGQSQVWPFFKPFLRRNLGFWTFSKMHHM